MRKFLKERIFFFGLFVFLCLICFIALRDGGFKTFLTYQGYQKQFVSENKNLELIVEPDDGIQPILDAISGAQTSIDLVMYELEDRQIEDALIAAEKRGVAVRVLLDNGYQGEGSKQNKEAFLYLTQNGIPTVWTSDKFALTHQKTLVIDGIGAVIMTFNFTPQYYATSRDFGIINRKTSDVEIIEETFNADWRGGGSTKSITGDLLWSPGSENALIALIKSARETIDVYNEEMADTAVTHALIDAAKRGVDVRVDMTYASNWLGAFGELSDAGVSIETFKNKKGGFYIHAKMVMVDDKVAFVGSENFSSTSLNDNRELGMLISNQNVIESLKHIFETDWQSADIFTIETYKTSPEQQEAQAALASSGVVKKSTSGICHTPGDSFYDRTTHYTTFYSLSDCVASGGRASK